MITIHEAKAADFTTLGFGALLPSECTVRERAGGMYELKIVHPITEDGRHHRIKPMRIIKAPAPVRETPLVEIDQTGTVARDIYKVVTGGMRLNMRADADIESKVIHAYKPGTEVCKLGVTGDWMQVAVLDGGATGWMWAENLEYVRTETDAIIGDAPGTVVRPRQTREQLFRIYRYSPDSKERAVTAEARHITYDLAGAVVEGEYSPENVPANQVCAQIMARADHDVSDFHIYCTVSTPISGEYGGRNILECLLDPETGVVAQAKARIVRDNYDVFILPDEVRSRGVELRYGKNLLSAYMDTDVSDTITRIKPVGKTRDGEKLYIEENGGWVESPYISDYPVVYSKEVEYDVVESDELPIDQARALLKEKAEADFMAGCDMATVKLDADFVRLELTEDYKHLANQYALHLYDSVPVIDRDADIVATARMTEYAYDAIIDEYQDTGLGELEEVGSTIYGYELAAGSVSGGKLIPNTVHGDRLQNLSISYGKFDLAAIKLLSADAIVAIRADIRELVAGNITTDQLYADIAVIAAAQITAANIDKANIKWAEIESLTAEIAKIVNAEIGYAEIDTAQIKNLSAAVATIVKAEIAIAEIDWAHIKNVEVETAQIKLGAITSALIAAGAIGTAQIADGSITEAKIVSLNADVITSGTLSTERLLIKGEGGLFYEINATAGGLTAAQLTEEQYKNAISGTALVARSVTADKIAAKSITSNEILSGTITAAEINVANLFAAEATIAALDSYIMRTTTIEALKGSLDIWASDKVRIAVDNLRIGGTNLAAFSNLTFFNEAGTLTGGLAEHADGKPHYCRSGKVIVLSPFSGNYDGAAFVNISLAAGKQYTVSFWASCDVDNTPLAVNIFNGGRGVDMNLGDLVQTGPTGGYYVKTFECPVTDVYELRFICFGGHTGTVHIMDAKMEEGTKATAWSPAPEDTDEAIDGLSAEMVVQAGLISANAEKIEKVNQSADSVAQRMTTAEANISALDGKIGAKVERSEFDALGKRVSAAEGELLVQADEISAEVARATDAEEKLSGRISVQEDKIELAVNRTVGGTNLAAFGQLAFANSAGTLTGAVEEREEAYYCRSGRAIRLKAFDGSYNLAGFHGISLAEGKEYTVSFWAAGEIDGTSVTVNIWNSGRGVDMGLGEAVQAGPTGGYYTRTFTCPTSDVYELRFIIFGAHAGYADIMDVKLEEGNTATAWSAHPEEFRAGSGVEITEKRVKISAPETLIAIPSEDGESTVAQFDENGLTASRVSARNLAYRYDGSSVLYADANATDEQMKTGGYYRSLADACAAVSGKNLDKDVTIVVAGDSYGSAILYGICGRGGLTVLGNGRNLTGELLIGRNTADVVVDGLTITATGTAAALQQGPGWMQWTRCKFIGNTSGGSYGLRLERHAAAFMYECELYNAEHLLSVGVNADVVCNMLKGGNGTNALYGDGGNVKWYGTRPGGNIRTDHPALYAPADLSALAIDYGTAQPSTPTIQTAEFFYLHSDSYRGGWEWFSDEDIRQGYISSGTIYGVIWFDAADIRSRLNGRTINQVSLRLHMHKGVGRGSAVSVQLYGSDVSYDRTAAPGLVTSYGTIGTTEPDTVSEITIPTQVIADILSGTIQALVLKSDDTELYKDRDYSRNYARFSGSTTATAENQPRLTVVYQ